MKLKNLVITGALALSGMLMAFHFIPNGPIQIGDEAPMLDQKMVGIDGAKKALKDFKKDKGLVVVFSCNTCPFVVGSSSFGGWEQYYNEYAKMAQEKGLGFVLVNSNEAKRSGDDSLDEMKKHAKDKGYTMPYLVDKNSELADAFGAKTTPHVFLLNGEMKLIYMGSIDNSWDSNRKEEAFYLKDAIQQYTSGAEISVSESAPRGCSIKRVK